MNTGDSNQSGSCLKEQAWKVFLKDKQKSLDQKFTHVESNSKFVDSYIKELQEMVEERKVCISKRTAAERI